MPKVSVIVPVYNGEKYINRCITSIANQTLDDIEIIAINDGSTDKSMDILDKLSIKYRDKLKVYDGHHYGVGAARNMGLEYANGDFIKFVDADDYLKLNVLEKMYDIAIENNVSLVRGNYQTLIGPFKTEDKCSWSNIEGNQIVDVFENKDYIVTETPGLGNKLMSRDVIDDIRFPEKTKWEDLAVVPAIMANSKKIYHLDEDVYNYRANLNTTVSDFINKIPNIYDIIKSLDNMQKEMKIRGFGQEYKEQIKELYILHTLFRVENVMCWLGFPKQKKKVVVSSLLGTLDAKYPGWEQNNIIDRYKKVNSLFKFDMNRLNKFIDQEYRISNANEAKQNLIKVLKK